MFTALIKDIVAANEGTQPERFQFVTEPEPDNNWIQQLFAIDLRALAGLRILLGIISAIFVFGQFSQIDLLYTDDSILSRDLNRQILGDGFWSLMWFSGSYNNARLILIVTGIVAGVFALGYQTKPLNILLVILLWSIQVRNPLILTGGDVLLRMLLFWMIFLPTNVVWSIDAWQSEVKKNDQWKIANLATMAIMLQVVFMYFFSGIAKLNAFWFSGDAVEYAMNLEMSVKPLGSWLSSYPMVMKIVTLATIFAEIITIFIMFIPRINHLNRGMMLGFFLTMHLGIWLTMSIGLFSITAIVAWLVFFPSDVFNTFFGEPVGFNEQNFYRNHFPLQDKALNIFAGSFLALVAMQNLASAFLAPGKVPVLDVLARSTMTVQEFHMFAKPPLFSPWFEYNAQLDSGQRVDIFFPERGNTVIKPESVYSYMQTQNWRRIHWNLITHPLFPPETELIYREIRRRLLHKIVKRWNSENAEDPVFQARLLCHLDPIRLHPDEKSKPVFANHQNHDMTWAVYER